MIWSGLDENKKKPIEVLQALSEARKSAAYLITLISDSTENGHDEWSSDQERFRFVSIAAAEGEKSMSSDLNDITRLETLVETLIASADRLTNDHA
jgi:hypothetical protein